MVCLQGNRQEFKRCVRWPPGVEHRPLNQLQRRRHCCLHFQNGIEQEGGGREGAYGIEKLCSRDAQSCDQHEYLESESSSRGFSWAVEWGSAPWGWAGGGGQRVEEREEEKAGIENGVDEKKELLRRRMWGIWRQNKGWRGRLRR